MFRFERSNELAVPSKLKRSLQWRIEKTQTHLHYGLSMCAVIKVNVLLRSAKLGEIVK